MHRLSRRAALLAIILTLAVTMLMPLAVAAYDWPTFSGVSQYQGDNDQETVLTTANVGGLHPSLPGDAAGGRGRRAGSARRRRDPDRHERPRLRHDARRADRRARCPRRDDHLAACVRPRRLPHQWRRERLLHDLLPRHRPEQAVRLQLRAGRLRAQVRGRRRHGEQRRRLAGTGHAQGVRREGLLGAEHRHRDGTARVTSMSRTRAIPATGATTRGI